jgi:hypothetical protein
MLQQEVLNMQIAEAQALENLREDPQVKKMLLPKNQRYAK